MTENQNKDAIQKQFGESLARIRKSKNLSRGDLAQILNLKENTVSAYELGRRLPTLEGVFEMACLLNVSMTELLGEDNSKTIERAKMLFEYDLLKALKLMDLAGFKAQIVPRDDSLTVAVEIKNVTEKPLRFKDFSQFVDCVQSLINQTALQNIGFRTAFLEFVKSLK